MSFLGKRAVPGKRNFREAETREKESEAEKERGNIRDGVTEQDTILK